ncbi:MAG: orotate phosphoribosyltransferase [Neisseriaceae bacterium]
MSDLQQKFLQFALKQNILRFGEFVTKFGRLSPYFFNAGSLCEGNSLQHLANFYAQTIVQRELKFDILFGPAYKGIVLAAATVLALNQKNINKRFAYNRKEAKDHGEGGVLVGAPLKGNVLIIDDVISSGSSIRQAIELSLQQGATPCGVLVALDRMEKGYHQKRSAIEEIQDDYGLTVTAIANLEDLLRLVQNNPQLQSYQEKIQAYREQYGTA